VVHDQGNLGRALEIPGRLIALHPVILKIPDRRDLANLSDITINVMGFIPLGRLR
jgi:hypothetical protein